ncbi:hypothetical protein QYM36_002965 [Artemia franciscana]|nr:hypothetical protein QYM36_002965 [Artemia franciscana]
MVIDGLETNLNSRAEEDENFRESLLKAKALEGGKLQSIEGAIEFFSGKDLADLQNQMNPLRNGMIYKKIIRKGSGSIVPPKALTTYHYASFCFIDGANEEDPFDSTYLRGTPFRKRIDSGRMIPGVEVALRSMKNDEQSYFLIHPDYAYGALGMPPRILPDCWIFCMIHLLRWYDCASATEYEQMTEEERAAAPWSTLRKAVESLVTAAKAAESRGDAGHAVRLLNKAKGWLLNRGMKSEEEELEISEVSAKVFRLLFIRLFKLGSEKNYKTALKTINETLHLKGLSDLALTQCYFYKGAILRIFKDFKKARYFLTEASKLRNRDEKILNELEELEKDENKEKELERAFAAKAVRGSIGIPASHPQKSVAEKDLINYLTSNGVKLEGLDWESVLEKVESFRNDGARHELILPDFMCLDMEMMKFVKNLSDYFRLSFEEVEGFQLFKIVKRKN